MAKVFVANIHYDITEEILKQTFSQIGPIVSCTMPLDRDSGTHRGYAFVEYSSKGEAEAAKASLDGIELGGRSLRVTDPKQKGAPQQGSAPGPAGTVPGMPASASPADVLRVPRDELLGQMAALKAQLEADPMRTRDILTSNPGFAYYILQAQIVLEMVDPIVMSAALNEQAVAAQPLGAPQPGAAPPAGMAAQQAALLQQVASLTPEQVAALPDVHRQQVEALRRQMNLPVF